MQDENNFFAIQVKEGDKITQLWPALPNSQTVKSMVEMGLSYQKTTFFWEGNSLVLTLTSPFAESKSFEDENNKLSIAPFYYIDLNYQSTSSSFQEKTISLNFGGFRNIKDNNGLLAAYYSDPSSLNAEKALAVKKTNNVKATAYKGSGGFNWQVNYPQNTEISFVLAGYNNNTVITNKEINYKFAYTNWFDNIDDVVSYAFENIDKIRTASTEFENNLKQSRLSPQDKWLAAQAFHAYLANSWLVIDENINPAYFVWEGEFKYLNTLDVTHDYDVLPGLYFPWVIKLELDSWKKAVKEDEKGIVIPHDLGLRFNLADTQAYKIPGWESSGMPVEENCNFILLAYWYWQQSSDDKYIKKLSPFIADLVSSLADRDSNANGIADIALGMTTYDSDSNSALKESPDSTYLGLKELSAYTAASEIFAFVKDNKARVQVEKEAVLISNAIDNEFNKKGYIPLSLDPDFVELSLFDGKTIKASEEQGFAYISGLFYPALTGLKSEALDKVISLLNRNYPTAYQKSLVKNKDGDLAGLQLTEFNDLHLGWFSHAMMADYIAEKLFGQEYQSGSIFFPYLYDNPYGFADGYYFRGPWYPLQKALLYYPRGAAIFAFLKK